MPGSFSCGERSTCWWVWPATTAVAEYFPRGEVFRTVGARWRPFVSVSGGMESAKRRASTAMNTDERRIIMESDFERALDSVLGAFEREGFNVRPVNGDGRFRVVSDHQILRCAELDVTLPELTFSGTAAFSPTVLGCRISMVELTSRSTVVSAKSPLVRYPVLSSLMPRIRSRVNSVLKTLVRGAAQTAA